MHENSGNKKYVKLKDAPTEQGQKYLQEMKENGHEEVVLLGTKHPQVLESVLYQSGDATTTNDTYVNQFPTLAPSYVLLTLGPNADEYEYLQQAGKPMITIEEMKQRLLKDHEPVHISCSEGDYDIVSGELRFNPDTDEYCPVTITFSKNKYIEAPQYFDLVIDPKSELGNEGISIHEEPLTKDLMLYIPLTFD